MVNKISDMISDDISSGLKSFLSKDIVEDKFDTYVGKVVDNNDPNKLGRCKVRVFGVFDNTIPNDDLPWAMPNNTFVGSLVGSFIVPPVGAIVNVYFDDWDVNLPHYTTKVIDKRNLPKNYAKNYPNNMVFFETDSGISFEIDRSNDDVIFTHSKGSKIIIDHSKGSKIIIDGTTGKITIESSADIETKYKTFWKDNGTAVIPSGQGMMCAMPSCPYGGFFLQGQQAIGA